MANKIMRIIIGIAILAGIAVGGWMVLPGSVKNPILAWYQAKTDDNYATIVDTIRATTVPKNKKVSFGAMMDGVSEDSVWTIEKWSVDDAGNGNYLVYADAYKVTVAVENANNSDGMVTHTNAHVRLVFDIEKQGDEMKIGKSKVEVGKACTPKTVIVGEYTYGTADKYFQPTLDCLASMAAAEE